MTWRPCDHPIAVPFKDCNLHHVPLDPAKLLAYQIPEVHQHVLPRDVAFYALSVGLGQNPLDERELDFVDAHRGLKVLPTMAAVLGHPGFWLADPRTGVDATQLVHGEQTIILHRPLPVSAEIIGRTSVTGLVDKGPGRGALLYSDRLVTDAASGALLATTRTTTFLRADGGCGPGPPGSPRTEPRPPHPMPPHAPDFSVDLPTRPEQALYYRLNGDDNPLHADPRLAAKAGFPRPILHGLCTMGVVGHAILRTLAGYAAAALTQIELRFAAPVFPGETIRTELWTDGSFRARVVERNVIVVNNGRVVLGR